MPNCLRLLFDLHLILSLTHDLYLQIVDFGLLDLVSLCDFLLRLINLLEILLLLCSQELHPILNSLPLLFQLVQRSS